MTLSSNTMSLYEKHIIDPTIFGVCAIKKWDSLSYDKTKSEFILEKTLRDGKLIVQGGYWWKVTLYQNDIPCVVCEENIYNSREYVAGVINVIVSTHADDAALTIEGLQKSLYWCESDDLNQQMAKEIDDADLSSISWDSIWPDPNNVDVNPSPCWGKYNYSIGRSKFGGWIVSVSNGNYGFDKRLGSLKECVEYTKTQFNNKSLPLK